jgi:hypothetical protein
MILECAKCFWPLTINPSDGRLPPWCPRCGENLQTRAGRTGQTSPPEPVTDGSSQLPPADEPQTEPVAARSDIIVSYEFSAVSLPPGAGSPVIAYSSSRWTVTNSPAPRTRRAALIGGVVCLAVAGALAWWSFHKDTTYGRVMGTVVRMVSGSKGRQYPEVAYAVNGREYTTHGNMSGVPAVGATVEVLYPPSDPGNGAIYDTAELWMPPVIPAILGTFSLLFSFGDSIQQGFGRRRSAAQGESAAVVP